MKPHAIRHPHRTPSITWSSLTLTLTLIGTPQDAKHHMEQMKKLTQELEVSQGGAEELRLAHLTIEQRLASSQQEAEALRDTIVDLEQRLAASKKTCAELDAARAEAEAAGDRFRIAKGDALDRLAASQKRVKETEAS